MQASAEVCRMTRIAVISFVLSATAKMIVRLKALFVDEKDNFPRLRSVVV